MMSTPAQLSRMEGINDVPFKRLKWRSPSTSFIKSKISQDCRPAWSNVRQQVTPLPLGHVTNCFTKPNSQTNKDDQPAYTNFTL